MKYQSCIGCPYYDRPGPIYGTGTPSAHAAFVGVGPVGGKLLGPGVEKVLDNSCRRAGINRQREFTTTLVKCELKPFEQPHPVAVAKCSHLLQQELNGLRNLTTTVTLGEAPFHALTGKDLKSVINRPKAGPGRKAKDMSPTLWMRGCPYPINNRKVIIPLMHPEFYMKTGFVTAYQLDADMQKVSRYINGKGRFYTQDANYSPTPSDIQDLIRTVRELGRAGIDIETPEDLDEDELRAGGALLPIDVIGISPNIDTVVGISPNQYESIKPLFTDPAHPVEFHVFNGSFDFYHLGKLFGPLRAVKQFDVMLGLNRWRSDLMKKDLAIAMSFFTDMEYTKNLGPTDPIKYQWADTTGVLEAGLTMKPVLEMQGLLKVVMEQDLPLHEDLLDPSVDGLNRMRELGIHADVREVMRFTKISEQMLEKYNVLWKKYFPTVDWQSPEQLFNLFTGPLKMPVIMRKRVKKKDGQRTTTTTPTCDADALKEYRDKYGSETANMILQMKMFKHLGDFAGIVAPDRRIHTAYLIHRQVQFRIQAVEPNIQQLPEKLGGYKTRRMVIPDDPDRDCILSIDASQCELRIYAWLAKAKNLLKAMADGVYIYGFMYEQIYGRSFFKPGLPPLKYNKADYVTEQEILAAKSGPLGYIYDRGWESVATKHKVSAAIAKASHGGFHAENPEIREFHKVCDREVARLGYQTNLWGGRRYFPTPRIQRNEYLSFHGQSNMGELLRANYLKPSFRHLPDFGGSRVLLTVHDSMAVNVKDGKVDPKRARDVAQFLYDNAEAPIEVMNGFVIPAEVKYCPNNWGDGSLVDWTKDERNRTVVLNVERS